MLKKNHRKRTSLGRPTIGLVLSGGGARGMAHIGVLRVLEREGIPVDFLAGTSFGGLIAAAYAAGMTPAEIEAVARQAVRRRHMLQLADVTLPRGGFIRGQRLLAFYEQLFGEKTFADLRLPLAVVAVDLNTYQEVVMDSGSVAVAVRATTSLPGVFMPLEWNGCRLIDGGLLNNLPVDVCRRQGAEKIVAVDIGLSRPHGVGRWIGSHRWVPGNVSDTLGALDDTLYTLRHAEQETRLQQFPPDLLIVPDLPSDINAVHGYNQVDQLIAAGEAAALAHLAELEALKSPRQGRFSSLRQKFRLRGAVRRVGSPAPPPEDGPAQET
jgi:NTE family protein